MRLILAAVGKLKAGPDLALFERYWDRLAAQGRKIGFASIRLVEIPEGRASDAASRKADEGRRLLGAVGAEAAIVALDVRGAACSSDAFAAGLRQFRDEGTATLAFLIGGPDGHGETVRTRAKRVMSMSAMTLPHGLARIVLAEQLYRATTIIAGHPYHRA